MARNKPDPYFIKYLGKYQGNTDFCPAHSVYWEISQNNIRNVFTIDTLVTNVDCQQWISFKKITATAK